MSQFQNDPNRFKKMTGSGIYSINSSMAAQKSADEQPIGQNS